MEEIYVSVDIETDGPIPYNNAMLSLGAAACTLTRGIFDQWTANFLAPTHSKPDPGTMSEFWDKFPEQYADTRRDLRVPKAAMQEFNAWVRALPGKPVMVAYPAGFDFTFTHWYFMNFLGEDPFGYCCLDMDSYAMALLKIPYKQVSKTNMSKDWFAPKNDAIHQGIKPQNREFVKHNALDDAIVQAYLFLSMQRWALDLE